eukprot:gnl/Spiro4/24029_TR11905_c0_g1_i1.p1 gnl/Spiro4/24029_TR11905_c0_g1~~gnl/Spiro4/24029_TR11905_c0_g1_i1.p1  ORF type:complete len:352 (+),score=39.55 gnl/Spiro4/24029_TR11905_c0_g1_i1:31-1056(+)
MGSSSTKLEKQLGNDFPSDEHYMGLDNFGNTCYCNSVLQALYYCLPFREQMIRNAHLYAPKAGEAPNLLSCLAELFTTMAAQKARVGSVAPRAFIRQLKTENALFDNLMHQDAQEFLNYLLNRVKEKLAEISPRANGSSPAQTWIHRMFQGTLTNETRCLTCETITNRDEPFLDLSIEINQDTSLAHCLRNFRATETLSHRDKFFCDHCCGLQEAQKCIRIRTLPPVLALHLKRFKYVEQLQQFKKLTYRVVFPLELKISNVADNADCEYHLFAVVVHIGSGPNYGHYVSIVRSNNHWLYFDDDNVELMPESRFPSFFGSAHRSECGYILFYQSQLLSSTT